MKALILTGDPEKLRQLYEQLKQTQVCRLEAGRLYVEVEDIPLFDAYMILERT